MILFAYDGEVERGALLAEIDKALASRGMLPLGQVRHDDKGAPVCDNYFISITHTDVKIIVAVSRVPVGVDIERSDRRPPRGVPDMASWTAYEAHCKSHGEGIRVSDIRSGLPRIRARRFDIFGGYTLAVAGGDDDCETVMLPKR